MCDPEAESASRQMQRVDGDIYATDVQTTLLEGYGGLQYDRLVERTTIQQGVKEGIVEPLVDKMKEEIYRRLASTPQERASLEALIGTVSARPRRAPHPPARAHAAPARAPAHAVPTPRPFARRISAATCPAATCPFSAQVFDVHRGLETTAKEENALKKLVEPVAPQARELVDKPDEDGQPTGPRRGDFVYDVPIRDELKAMVKANSGLLDELRTASDAWAQSARKPGDSTVVYADIPDGDVMRSHARLGTSADRSDGSVRLAFILYYDDLEVVNPLGAFHGRHKLGLFYWALVNTAVEERMALHNMHLATVALVHDIDYYGISQVVSGLPGDTSFGSSMTELDQGVSIAGALVRGWVVVVSADYPAAGLLAGFKKSVSANFFCRECDCDQSEDAYPCANSFVEANADLEQQHLLREAEEYVAQLAHYLSLGTATAREAYLASIGVTTFEEHAFTRIPLFDLCRMIPYDFMHVELEGSLKNELAAMLYYFIRHRAGWGFTLAKLNQRIREYPWPGGFRVPSFTEGVLEKGTKGGQCKKGCHVHMTAGDVMVFVRHSIDILLPLVGDKSDPLWQCWVAHVKYVRLLMQKTLTADDVAALDRLIYEHHKLFLGVCESEYGERLFKPKNHFATHFPIDIMNFGPVRGYWCMRFEALNQLFKNFAKTGSFRDTPKRCAEYWAIQSARLRDSQRVRDWGNVRIVHGSLPRTYRRSSPSATDPPAVARVFSIISSDNVSLEWIRTLYYGGDEYAQGVSWLTAKFNSERLLGFIPKNGLFRMHGKFYVLLLTSLSLYRWL